MTIPSLRAHNIIVIVIGRIVVLSWVISSLVMLHTIRIMVVVIDHSRAYMRSARFSALPPTTAVHICTYTTAGYQTTVTTDTSANESEVNDHFVEKCFFYTLSFLWVGLVEESTRATVIRAGALCALIRAGTALIRAISVIAAEAVGAGLFVVAFFTVGGALGTLGLRKEEAV